MSEHVTICEVCRERPSTPSGMCRPCRRSYDTTLGGDIWSVIVWAAARARWFERRRQRAAGRDGSRSFLTAAPMPWAWKATESEVTGRPTQWDLRDGNGRSRATVWRNGLAEFTWSTWDERGTGGENDTAGSLNDAKDLAVAAIVRQGWAPGGWRVSW